MNPKLKIAIVLATFIVGLIGFTVVKNILIERDPPSHSMGIMDGSLSTQGGCDSLVESSRKAIKLPQMQQKGSTLTVLVTGDSSTANEPRSLGNYPVPYSNKVLERASTITQKQEEILAQIKEKCEKTPPSKNSSIFLGLKSGVEQLKSQGCNEKTKCTLFLKSDLQENVEPQIKAAINGDKSSLTKLPTPIDNRGINITICGVAETNGTVKESNGGVRQLTQNRNAAQLDLIRQIWGKLFTEPQSVSFSSFCTN